MLAVAVGAVCLLVGACVVTASAFAPAVPGDVLSAAHLLSLWVLAGGVTVGGSARPGRVPVGVVGVGETPAPLGSGLVLAVLAPLGSRSLVVETCGPAPLGCLALGVEPPVVVLLSGEGGPLSPSLGFPGVPCIVPNTSTVYKICIRYTNFVYDGLSIQIFVYVYKKCGCIQIFVYDFFFCIRNLFLYTEIDFVYGDTSDTPLTHL